MRRRGATSASAGRRPGTRCPTSLRAGPRRPCRADERAELRAIINAAAQVYRGVIPADRWHEPYMPREDLTREIEHGVEFWVAEDDGAIAGVMGIQDKGDVALVRHAYVMPTTQRSGIGTRLLRHVEG